MRRWRFLHKAPRLDVGACFGQHRFQFAFSQVVILRNLHHHKAILAAHRDYRFRPFREHGFDGGDTDGDNKLDIDETWLFSCTTNVTESVTDTGTATGHDGNTKVEDKAQAHVDVADPTPTPEPTPTPTPTPAPADPQPTPTEAQPTPTDSVEQPSGEVEAATGRPRTTLPPTDTTDGSNGGTGSGLPIVLIALLGIAVAIGLLSPTSNRSRRRSRRE